MTKRIYTTMIVGLMAGMVLLTGCKREYGTVTLGANIDKGRDAKVYIDDLTPCWHNNDLIRVNNQTCTTSAALGSSAQITDVVESNHYRAIYPADIVGDVDISSSNTIAVTLPHEQIYEVDSRGDQKVKVPMGAYSSNESLTFHNLCPLIKVVVSNRMNEDFSLDHITVTANTAYLSGRGRATVTGSSNDAIEMVSSSATHDVSLVFPTMRRPIIGRGDRDTYVFYIVSPEFVQDDVTITLYSANGQYSTCEKRASLQHNKMAGVNLTIDQWDGQVPIDPPSVNGVLPGVFSVSATQQVHFSQGNLQYQASTNTWRFAEHQYDYIGYANSNISPTYSGWIDLFAWGTSGWNSGAACYQPWSTSPSYNDYSLGIPNMTDLSGIYTEADWAWHNAISNGGNASHLWRTLTKDEWYYLLAIRTEAFSKLGTGSINGVGGLIILPDNWTSPSGCVFSPLFAPGNADWTHNSYTLAQWAQMEDNGAVFLPAAGIRESIEPGVEGYVGVGDVGYAGYYWSATQNGDHNAYYTYICSAEVTPLLYKLKMGGCSVRPIQDID